MENFKKYISVINQLAKDGIVFKNINPIYIPRNHNVQKAIKAAYQNDLEPMNELLAALKNPFSENREYSHLAIPPKEDEKILETFCGT